MAPKARVAASAASSSADRVPEVRYSCHVLLSHQRPYPTQQGALMKNALEQKGIEDLEALFSNQTSEARNRPMIAFSTLAGAVSHLHAGIEEGLASGILGDGMKPLRDELAYILPSCEAVNTYGPPDADRSEEGLKRATQEIFDCLRRLRALPEYGAFVMMLLKMGAGLQHVALQLAEWSSLIENIKDQRKHFHRFGDQPCGSELKDLVMAEESSKTLRKRLASYLAKSLSERKRARVSAPARGGIINFANMGRAAGAGDEEEEEG